MIWEERRMLWVTIIHILHDINAFLNKGPQNGCIRMEHGTRGSANYGPISDWHFNTIRVSHRYLLHWITKPKFRDVVLTVDPYIGKSVQGTRGLTRRFILAFDTHDGCKAVSSGHKCKRARSSVRAYIYLVIQTTCFLFTIRFLFTNHSQRLSSSIPWMLCSWSLNSMLMFSRRRRCRRRCWWFRLPFRFCIHVPVRISFLDSPLSYSPHLNHVDGNMSGEDKQKHA